MATTNRKADPVVTEIISNGVIAVTEEMKTNLMRTAYNTIIYEALDFTTGLFTREGETISIGIGLPMFIRGMSETVKAKIKHFGYDAMEPGDIYITNDSYTTGSHLNHVTLTMPIFSGGKLTAFSCCMAHWIDIGGVLGGVTTDIFSEGLQIPYLKLYREGVINQDLVDFIRMNVRIPTRALGDLRAQVTAVKTGERRFGQLLDRYGREPVLAAIAAIMDHSEHAARARTKSIPDGVYEAESYMDDDGISIGKKVPIRVKVTVAGDEITVDLTEVSNQVQGFYNSGITTGYACAQVAYKCLTSPTDYPINDGSFRSLNVIVPPGRVISAQRPAPMRWWMTFPMTIVDTVFKAMEKAIPDRKGSLVLFWGMSTGGASLYPLAKHYTPDGYLGWGTSSTGLAYVNNRALSGNFNDVYERMALRVRERGLDDFEFYTKNIDPKTRALWWKAAQKDPRFKSTEDEAMQFGAGALTEQGLRLWQSDFLPAEARKGGLAPFMQAMFEPSYPPAELKKVPVLDLNGTNDEALPPATVDANRKVMEPYAGKYRVGRIEGLHHYLFTQNSIKIVGSTWLRYLDSGYFD